MRLWKKLVVAAVVGLVSATAVRAGGFERGVADISVLYDDQLGSVAGSFTYVAPQRSFTTITPVAGAPGPLVPAGPAFSGVYSRSYTVPSLSARLGDSTHGACAGTYVTPFGAHSDYSGFLAGSAPDGTINQQFTTREFGLTCAARFMVGPGRLHLVGGVFLETFKFSQTQLVAPLTVAGTSASDSGAFGYRLGLAYDIPQYGMLAQLLYRSGVNHSATGFVTGLGAAIPIGISGTLPQSIALSVRSGIAPGWLAFGSVKWTDWSVLPSIAVMGPVGPLRVFTLNYRDGWTVSGGVARVFSKNLIGTAAVVWDRGVGTGADIQTDTWTLGLGATYRLANGGEISAGAAFSYLTAGAQSVAQGAAYNATAGGDFAYTLRLSAKVPF